MTPGISLPNDRGQLELPDTGDGYISAVICRRPDGSVGWQALPPEVNGDAWVVGFAIEPHQSRPVPVLVGTASVVPDLGYAVPAGQWWLVIALQTDNGNTLTEPLEITITP